ncbi:1-pyrroline-5-carboxylate dehydrogenase [Alkalihalobacillus alcalophilus ATCC 27647 = CGMCC 1.3604]|uniref:1-pyrroline-5-carboxylate dehydrogenase n=1 Tax=Alkalihalobacillus alcalophilus ATCC 27647 = CGMCC 1.3604 TaxID=1218173 RepID=A0A094YV89_ALKAL|nr:L-glutamate gamma-semialdehyde dehydrogenase [Alkalihalobacillus alcalophilus]KGA97432.1 1-pyrroline-5-carboxylate dehydrogenase [Alkalihalobacillus alcalophilus ATCC 27647 = CGMCC 1.3604]MED1562252.1 L-glutamate gamma-semialdehyde dehydrogenase [Alkalihalobacillus alcalophilus]THG89640.1 1-pyrroline-5-carboxylate dehydrogenase [Alkalihalobacillus alcalophilus ATCC 27647 = CGMCC 1.3604]
MTWDYKHEPFTDFSDSTNQAAFKEALALVKKELGKEYPIVIGGKKIFTEDKIVSENPSNHKEIVGYVSKASRDHAEQAHEAAQEAFKTWKTWSAESRSAILFRAAGLIRKRKHEFSAYLVYEAGKPWKEADADTAEGIDFLEYYGRQMLSLKDGVKIHSREQVEHNQYNYIPLGVGVTISPWNFAFAIMAGTTIAPVVAGNTVLLKPASTTPVIAYKFMEILEEAGLPAGVVNFIPGSGSEIGDYLVDHPKTAFVNFTGSKDVGVRIYERAAKVHPGQKWFKRVAIEMGGKDTIIVDNDSNIETAVQSIVQSAFGFSGQKCSACSRAVIHEDVYDEVLEKVVAETEKLTVGDPTDYTNYMGPVNDQAAFDKVKQYIEIGSSEGKLMVGGTGDNSTGYFVNPTVFADVAPDARLMQEEIFGPVVAFSKAKDFDHLLEIANNTEYGLTGAIISNNREHLERARHEFHVGNLYFNRSCTGAIVGYQPFGGFNMSGTDSKAGGPDHLLLFLQPKTVSDAL